MMATAVNGGFIYGFLVEAGSDDLALLCFEAAPGLKTNLVKLELVPMGNVSNVSGWDSIIEKMERKLGVGKDFTCLRVVG